MSVRARAHTGGWMGGVEVGGDLGGDAAAACVRACGGGGQVRAGRCVRVRTGR